MFSAPGRRCGECFTVSWPDLSTEDDLLCPLRHRPEAPGSRAGIKLHTLSQRKSIFRDKTRNVAEKKRYYVEYFVKYLVFLYISCYFSEI